MAILAGDYTSQGRVWLFVIIGPKASA